MEPVGHGASQDLPPGCSLVQLLAERGESRVDLVERDGVRLVVRRGPTALAEAAVAVRVQHPGLVAPVEWGRLADGRPYLLRPWVDGRPFDAAVAGLPAAALAARARQVLEVLAVLHEAGFVHRDIRASNVLVTPEDAVVLIDLDLARRATAPGAAAGAPLHCAPEVLLEQAHDRRSDLFSVGAMLAYASLGPPDPAFHEDFPVRSFWEAARLDPARLPSALAPLVRALVRRRPGDRPVDARAALGALAGASLDSPHVAAIPFLAGREAAFDELVEAAKRPGRAVIVSVAPPGETAPLARALDLELAVGGMATRRRAWIPDGKHEASAVPADVRLVAYADDELVSEALGDACVEWALELAWEVLVGADEAAGGLMLVLPERVAQPVSAALTERLLTEEVDSLLLRPWGGVPVQALVDHLDACTGGASPDLAARLARDLVGRTGGSVPVLDAHLARAGSAGVWRRGAGGLTLLRDRWPDDDPGLTAPPLPPLSASALRLLQALAVLGGRAARRVARAVARAGEPVEPDVGRVEAADVDREADAAEAELVAAGLVAVAAGDAGDGGGDEWIGAGAALRAASEGLAPADRPAWHRRAAAALASAGAPPAVVARQHAALVEDDASELAVLGVADAERRHGRYAEARGLLQRLERRRGKAGATAATLRRALALRLDIAQGSAERALADLRIEHRGDLARCPPRLRLAAAIAAEQSGRRQEARDLYASVLADVPTGDEACWATMGLAYADLLDGSPDGVLERIGDGPPADAPDEPAVALLNLKGVACTRLGRHDEAERHLAAAHAWATRADDPAAVGRTELNQAYLDRRRDRTDRALAILDTAVERFDRAGHVGGRALALNNLGVLHRDRGELARARDLLGRALSLRRRVGDAHGAMSSMSNLALVTLDAGQVGVALDLLDRADELAARGGYGSEQGVLAWQRLTALALAGRAEAAARCREHDVPDGAAAAHPALAGRAEALVHLLAGRTGQARAAARASHAAAVAGGDGGESYRAASLWLALAPDEGEAADALRAAGRRLAGAPVREAETAWRLALAAGEVDETRLDDWIRCFADAGRTDLLRGAARVAAACAGRDGDAATRRRHSQLMTQTAETLGDGLLPEERRNAVRRIDALAGMAWPGEHAGLPVGWYLDCNRRMAAESDLEGLLATIVDAALEVTGARRGLLMLLDAQDFEVEVARGADGARMAPEDARFSRTLVRRAIDDGEPLVVTDASRDDRFAGAVSIDTLRLRSVLCVPFRSGDGLRGALYLDDAGGAGVFDETDVASMRSLADQAAIAITNLRRRDEILRLNARLQERVRHQESELEQVRTTLRRRGTVPPVGGLVGESEAMHEIYRLVERFAPTDLPVLVTGPSGTGKDLVARALHERSRRAEGPLIVENVAALPGPLLESEMFGHVRGAFTGADRDRVGLFAEADGGTFVLDEIGEMPPELQAKLLRVLESGEFRPVGSRRTVRADVRIVAVTNRNLLERVRAGAFREDLYYRLDAAEVRLPPLSDRLEDVPVLARHFLRLLNEKHGTDKPIADEVLATLVRRSWPGNVRELNNEVSRLYFLSDARVRDPALVRPDQPSSAEDGAADPMPSSLRLEDVERAALERALRAAGGRKDRAARLLGISRAGLYAKLRRLGVGPEGSDGD